MLGFSSMSLEQESGPKGGRIFLCHSSGDKEVVRKLYRRLQADGFNPWLDEAELLPGQEWDLEIARAVRSSAVVLVCLSEGSVNKAGYVQKEIRFALDRAAEQPEGAIFMVPVRLEECAVPDRLKHWQWVNLFEEHGYSLILRALARKGLVAHLLKPLRFRQIRELRTFAYHTALVYDVALTVDGQLAISASYDKTVKVWEVASGRLVHTLTGHSAPVYSVALSKDGRIVVSASYDHTLKVWEVSGRCLHTLRRHGSPAGGVALSLDGRVAVSGSHDGTLRVWDVTEGSELRTIVAHASAVTGVALSADGRVAVSASTDKKLKVWEVESGRLLHALTGHSGSVDDVALSRVSWQAVSASADGTLKVWEVDSGRQLRTLTRHTGPVHNVNVALSADGRLAASSAGRMLNVWEVESGTFMADYLNNYSQHSVSRCAFLSDRELIAGVGNRLVHFVLKES
jgi:WD40 repeat protein